MVTNPASCCETALRSRERGFDGHRLYKRDLRVLARVSIRIGIELIANLCFRIECLSLILPTRRRFASFQDLLRAHKIAATNHH